MFILTLVVLYFAGLILAVKSGYHVDGLWLVPVLLVVAAWLWRDCRASRHQPHRT